MIDTPGLVQEYADGIGTQRLVVRYELLRALSVLLKAAGLAVMLATWGTGFPLAVLLYGIGAGIRKAALDNALHAASRPIPLLDQLTGQPGQPTTTGRNTAP